MSIIIGICDDKVEDIKRLTQALYAYDSSFQISTYTDGESLLEDCFEQKILFDILFMDIYMPGLNGIETAGKIRSFSKEVKIVFVSSSNEHYPEAYDVFAFNYLLKPIQLEKLNRVLDQVLISIVTARSQQINFNYKSKSYRVFCKDILYVESNGKIICFHIANSNKLFCYAKLDDILKQLPEESFIRCHQSYAVNVLHVTEMAENYFSIGAAVISISKKYLKPSKDKYFEYLFAHMNKGL